MSTRWGKYKSAPVPLPTKGFTKGEDKGVDLDFIKGCPQKHTKKIRQEGPKDEMKQD